LGSVFWSGAQQWVAQAQPLPQLTASNRVSAKNDTESIAHHYLIRHVLGYCFVLSFYEAKPAGCRRFGDAARNSHCFLLVALVDHQAIHIYVINSMGCIALTRFSLDCSFSHSDDLPRLAIT